jgi:hypothetical protein
MASTTQKFDKPEVIKKTKTEIVSEYNPIIGEILGFWRVQQKTMLGQRIEVHLNHSLEEYDRLFINGKEVELNSLKYI